VSCFPLLGECCLFLILKDIMNVLFKVICYFKFRLSFSKHNLTLSHGRRFGARRSPDFRGSLCRCVTQKFKILIFVVGFLLTRSSEGRQHSGCLLQNLKIISLMFIMWPHLTALRMTPENLSALFYPSVID